MVPLSILPFLLTFYFPAAEQRTSGFAITTAGHLQCLICDLVANRYNAKFEN